MKKYNKKIALVLALALTLALAIPALAQQTEIEGSYKDDSSNEINVTVTGSNAVKAILNPEGYAVQYDTVPTPLEASGNVTTLPIVGINHGADKVKVKATVTSVLNGKFKFASSAPKDTAAGTTGMVFLEAKAVDATAVTGADGALDNTKIVGVLNGWSTAARTGIKADVSARKNNVVVLKKGTVSSKAEVCAMNGGQCFVARLSGYVSGGDTKGNKPDKAWASYDGFNATVIWSFETDTSSGS